MTSANGTSLGRMERVDLRDVWQNEAGGFTPWLAKEDNLSLLADTIGIELELEATEKDVGPFRADILCRDTSGDHWVLIENQLESTDHKHLGQLLTYAAGLKAVTIVWIAQTFTDEHRAALDWLNDVTGERVNFFGLEIELWRIGNSPAAPKFNIVSQPNDWRETVIVGPGELTDTRQLQLEFWTQFKEVLAARAAKYRASKPRPRYWLPIRIGKSGVHLAGVASMWNSQAGSYDTNELRAELVFTGRRADRRFNVLVPHKGAIESEVGNGLTWLSPADTMKRRIYARRDANLNDKSKWPEYHLWLADKLDALHKVFLARAPELDVGGSAPDDESEPEE